MEKARKFIYAGIRRMKRRVSTRRKNKVDKVSNMVQNFK